MSINCSHTDYWLLQWIMLCRIGVTTVTFRFAVNKTESACCAKHRHLHMYCRFSKRKIFCFSSAHQILVFETPSNSPLTILNYWSLNDSPSYRISYSKTSDWHKKGYHCMQWWTLHLTSTEPFLQCLISAAVRCKCTHSLHQQHQMPSLYSMERERWKHVTSPHHGRHGP